jgi:hypothetical protein
MSKNFDPMSFKDIYIKEKTTLDQWYYKWFNAIQKRIDRDKDYQLDDDSSRDLIIDLMLSNVLGEITTFDEVSQALRKFKLQK